MLEVVPDFWLYDANVHKELRRGSSIKNERRPGRLRHAELCGKTLQLGLDWGNNQLRVKNKFKSRGRRASRTDKPRIRIVSDILKEQRYRLTFPSLPANQNSYAIGHRDHRCMAMLQLVHKRRRGVYRRAGIKGTDRYQEAGCILGT